MEPEKYCWEHKKILWWVGCRVLLLSIIPHLVNGILSHSRSCHVCFRWNFRWRCEHISIRNTLCHDYNTLGIILHWSLEIETKGIESSLEIKREEFQILWAQFKSILNQVSIAWRSWTFWSWTITHTRKKPLIHSATP